MPDRQADIELRRAVADDAPRLLALSVRAIRASAAEHYSAAELDAWAGRLTLADHADLVDHATVLVAEDAGTLAGWGALLLPEGELDRLYVDPDHGGRGVGRSLLDALEAAGRDAGCTVLDARASHRALRTFVASGWIVVADEVVVLDGQRLGRTHVRKRR